MQTTQSTRTKLQFAEVPMHWLRQTARPSSTAVASSPQISSQSTSTLAAPLLSRALLGLHVQSAANAYGIAAKDICYYPRNMLRTSLQEVLTKVLQQKQPCKQSVIDKRTPTKPTTLLIHLPKNVNKFHAEFLWYSEKNFNILRRINSVCSASFFF